jgi:hypothetical protein
MDSTYTISGSPAPTARRTADLDGPDYYPTPSWATEALLQVEQFSKRIWEPACGDGAMAEVLLSYGHDVYSTDLYDRGYGVSGEDFTEATLEYSNIVTNPPFHSAQQFAERGIELATEKVALLLRLAFLESAHRAKTIFSVNPPARVWVFSERITFYPKDAIRRGSGTTAYAWFVWDKAATGKTELGWLPTGMKRRAG